MNIYNLVPDLVHEKTVKIPLDYEMVAARVIVVM